MKSKFLLTVFLGLLSINLLAQPLNWREDSPSNFVPMTVVPDFNNFSHGTVSTKITFTETGTPWFVSDLFNVAANTAFNFSLDFLDNDPGGEYIARVYFVNGSGSETYQSSSYTVDNPSWQTLSITGTSPADAVQAYILIRILDVAASWTGSAKFNIDNAFYAENGGATNLVPNGDFESWNPPVIADGAKLIDWFEDSPSNFAPMTVVPDITNVSHGFVSAKLTFTETGTPWFVSKKFNVSSNTAFNFSLDFLDNDPGGEYIARVYFVNGSGSETYQSSSYTVDNPSWQTLSITGTSPVDAVQAYILIRILDVAANWTGSAIFNIDNAKFTEGGNSINLISNPSFEEWNALSESKDIKSFVFEGLSPAVEGMITLADHSISLEVPHGTDVTALIPTITISDKATINPASGVANNFASPVTYTVTAEDGSTQDWTVTVTVTPAGQTTIFFEDFENMPDNIFPAGWVLINQDGFIQDTGEERWQDSAWVVTTSGRVELAGNKVAMASSICSNIQNNQSVNDWMILPKITLGANSTLSWQAMSTTSSGNWPDDYMVVIAPYVNGVTPSEQYFVDEGYILMEIKPESWSAFVSNPGQGLKSRSVNLRDAKSQLFPDGWANRDVWIAFVLITDLYTNPNTGIPNPNAGGSNLAIDNIKVVNNPLTGIGEIQKNNLYVKIFPNPSNGEFYISLTLEKKGLTDIQITNLAGKTIFSNSLPVTAGQNRINMNVSELPKGIYLIRTSVNGYVNTSRLLLK